MPAFVIQLIIYGVMFAAVSATIVGFIAHERNIGATGQKEKDAPIIAAATKRAVDAETANEQFQKDYGVLKSACDATAQTVNTFTAEQDKAKLLSARILTQLAANEQRTASRIADLKAGATVPTGGCDEKAVVLRGVATDLLRGESP